MNEPRKCANTAPALTSNGEQPPDVGFCQYIALWRAAHGVVVTVIFCTTCRNRTQHLRETLPRNLADNPGAKQVVLNYNSQDDLLEYLFSIHAREIDAGRLVVYSTFDEPVFRMAHAKNQAHRLGIAEGGDILVNLDADNMTGPRFDQYITDRFKDRDDIFLWANVNHGRHIRTGVRVVRGLSGRIVVTRNAFFKTGGYDEKYDCWSPDDKNMNLRLRLLNYEPVEIDVPHLLGVPHNEKIRFKEYPHLAHASAEYFETVNRNTVTRPVVNGGMIGCGVVYRNRDFHQPLVLEPLPSRIFDIGMHKTATTSLHHALEILGYESWHWSSAHAAKAIWREMTGWGRSPTLEAYHGACDLPIPLLYDRLDKAYPGSRFILTIRNEEKWLDAVRRHFDPKHNPWRASWDSDAFSHRIHEIIYKRVTFDAEVFLARYRKHNADVLAYFAGRSKDLLVFRTEDGDGWPELCGFLGTTMPGVEYPRANIGI